MPLPATGLTLHVNASDTDRLWKEEAMSTHPSDGETVAVWDDEDDATTYGFHESVGLPTYRSSGINSLGALDFDGSNDVLRSSNDDASGYVASSTFMTASAWTYYIAFMLDGDGTDYANIYDNAALFCDIQAYFGLAVKTTAGVHSLIGWNYDTAADVTTPSLTLTVGVPYVACLKLSGGTLSLNLNDGEQTASVSSGNTGSIGSALSVGGNEYVSRFASARIGELAIYNTGVSGADDVAAWSYLSAKWLPGGGGPSPTMDGKIIFRAA